MSLSVSIVSIYPLDSPMKSQSLVATQIPLATGVSAKRALTQFSLTVRVKNISRGILLLLCLLSERSDHPEKRPTSMRGLHPNPLLIAQAIVKTSLMLILLASSVFFCSEPDLCKNEIIAEYPSPDAAHRVVVFSRDCGATTGYSTHASILEKGQPLINKGGNAFITDVAGKSSISASWRNNASVVLLYHRNDRVFRMESEVHGVRVIYSENAQ